jgi:WD40 repeat protein
VGGSIVIWDILEQKAIRAIPSGSAEISRIALSADGQHLAWLASDGTVRVTAIEDERPATVLRGKTGAFTGMAFSPVGHLLATVTTAPELVLWDVATAQRVPTQFAGMTGPIAALAFSPDGRLVAGAGGQEMVWVWDAWSGRPVTQFPTQFWITSLAFSPDGQYLAAGGGQPGKLGEIRVWKLAGDQPVCECQGHTDVVRCLVFSPESNRLISGSTDETIKVWELIDGQETMALREHTGAIRALVFSPDRQWLISASSDGTIKMWEGPTGAVEKRPRP